MTIKLRFRKKDGTNIPYELDCCPFPIGHVMTNGRADFDPNKYYPNTKWQRIKGRVIVGVDESQTEFATANKTGGHKEMQTHSHDISIGNGGSHNHSASTSISSTQLRASFACYNMAYVDMHGAGRVAVRQDKVNAWTGHASNSRNFGVWDFNGDHDHTASTSVASGGAHGHSATISNAGTGDAENLQPYITKYVWERIS